MGPPGGGAALRRGVAWPRLLGLPKTVGMQALAIPPSLPTWTDGPRGTQPVLAQLRPVSRRSTESREGPRLLPKMIIQVRGGRGV